MPEAKLEADGFRQNVIYDDDDRKDWSKELSEYQANIANATVAIFKKDDLIEGKASYTINRGTYGKEFGLCESEAFFDQKLGPRCTGVLVAEDLILTAGHCIPRSADCTKDYLFHFKYRRSLQAIFPNALSKAESFHCSDVIFRLENQIGDLALVRLDRPVVGVVPVNIFQSPKSLNYGTEVEMTGYPSGLPLKIVTNSKVISKSDYSFKANLDAFGGNSGSPVFSKETGGLLGILIKGEFDFVQKGQCKVEQKCSQYACSGELVSSIDNVVEQIDQYRKFKAIPNKRPGNNNKPVIYSSFIPLEIPDGDYIGTFSSLNVHEAPAGRQVSIGIDLVHEWIGDLRIIIYPPNHQAVILRDLKASVSEELKGVFGFDLTTEQSLSPLQNLRFPGVWKLQVIDLKSGDSGRLKNWRVIFN